MGGLQSSPIPPHDSRVPKPQLKPPRVCGSIADSSPRSQTKHKGRHKRRLVLPCCGEHTFFYRQGSFEGPYTYESMLMNREDSPLVIMVITVTMVHYWTPPPDVLRGHRRDGRGRRPRAAAAAGARVSELVPKVNTRTGPPAPYDAAWDDI